MGPHPHTHHVQGYSSVPEGPPTPPGMWAGRVNSTKVVISCRCQCLPAFLKLASLAGNVSHQSTSQSTTDGLDTRPEYWLNGLAYGQDGLGCSRLGCGRAADGQQGRGGGGRRLYCDTAHWSRGRHALLCSTTPRQLDWIGRLGCLDSNCERRSISQAGAGLSGQDTNTFSSGFHRCQRHHRLPHGPGGTRTAYMESE